ncbi:unnamed protein product, partial [Musa acuminata subsp. burmannicoides]
SAASHDLEGRWNQGNKRKHGTVSWKKALRSDFDVCILTPPNPKKVAEGDGGVIVKSSCSHLDDCILTPPKPAVGRLAISRAGPPAVTLTWASGIVFPHGF